MGFTPKGSNPRSPRRATAILSIHHIQLLVHVPILDRPEERPQCQVSHCGAFICVPILDRPEERPQLVAFLRWLKGWVPILDRPEERPQSTPNGTKLRTAEFQSSIAPKSDRNVVSVDDRALTALFQSSIAPKSDRNQNKIST